MILSLTKLTRDAEKKRTDPVLLYIEFFGVRAVRVLDLTVMGMYVNKWRCHYCHTHTIVKLS
jgi:hypothetical protein